MHHLLLTFKHGWSAHPHLAHCLTARGNLQSACWALGPSLRMGCGLGLRLLHHPDFHQVEGPAAGGHLVQEGGALLWRGPFRAAGLLGQVCTTWGGKSQLMTPGGPFQAWHSNSSSTSSASFCGPAS